VLKLTPILTLNHYPNVSISSRWWICIWQRWNQLQITT